MYMKMTKQKKIDLYNDYKTFIESRIGMPDLAKKYGISEQHARFIIRKFNMEKEKVDA